MVGQKKLLLGRHDVLDEQLQHHQVSDEMANVDIVIETVHHPVRESLFLAFRSTDAKAAKELTDHRLLQIESLLDGPVEEAEGLLVHRAILIRSQQLNGGCLFVVLLSALIGPSVNLGGLKEVDLKG